MISFPICFHCGLEVDICREAHITDESGIVTHHICPQINDAIIEEPPQIE